MADDDDHNEGEEYDLGDADTHELAERMKKEMARAEQASDDEEDDLFGPEPGRRTDDQLTGSGRQMQKIVRALARNQGNEAYEEDVNPYLSDVSAQPAEASGAVKLTSFRRTRTRRTRRLPIRSERCSRCARRRSARSASGSRMAARSWRRSRLLLPLQQRRRRRKQPRQLQLQHDAVAHRRLWADMRSMPVRRRMLLHAQHRRHDRLRRPVQQEAARIVRARDMRM